MTNIVEVPSKEFFLQKSGKAKMLTLPLFIEIRWDEDLALYTLGELDKEFNGKIYRSLKQLYMEEADTTEYLFANKYFFNYEHWCDVANSPTIRKRILQWRLELRLKLQAEGLKGVVKSAQNGNVNMAKWLANRGWVTEDGDSESSKSIETATKKKSASEQAEKVAIDELNEDFERLGKVISINK